MTRSARGDPSRDELKALREKLRRLERECRALHEELEAAQMDAAASRGAAVVADNVVPLDTTDPSWAVEEQLAGILEISADAIISIDSRGMIRLFNRGAENIFGYAAEEIIGKPLETLLPRHFREGHRAHIERFACSDETSRMMQGRGEIFGLRKNGGEFPAEASIAKSQSGGRVSFTVVLRDISERRQAEFALHENEALFRSIIDNLPMPAHIKDPDGCYVLVNPEYERQFGHTDAQTKGMMVEQLYPPQIAEQAVAQDRKVMESGQAVEAEFVVGEGEDARYYLTIKTPLLDADGNTAAIVCVETDITARKKAEAALAEREAQLSQAQQMARIGAFIWDKITNRCMYCSEELAGLFGLSVERFITERGSHEELLAAMHPDDRSDYDRAIKGANRNVRPYDVEFRTYDESGELKYFRESGQPETDENGRIVRFFGTMQDVTAIRLAEEALRESEGRFRSLIEGSIQGAVIHRDFEMLFMNQAWADIFGYEDIEDALAAGTVLDFIAPEEHDRLRAIMEARKRGDPSAPARYEYRGIRKDGARIWVENVGRVVNWEGGQAILSMTIDVTERKNAEEALRKNMRATELLRRIATAANEATSASEAMRECLREVCEYGNWPVGDIFVLAEDGSDALVPADIWHMDDPEHFAEIRERTRGVRFESGEGLPGRVIASAEPAWIHDLRTDPRYPGARRLGEIGVRASFGFPVLIGRKVVAALECFAEEVREPDPHLLDVAAQAGTILGRVLERQRAEQALRDSEERIRTLTENLPVNVVNVDKDERYLFVNKMAEAWYRMSASDLIGKRIADVFDERTYRKIESRIRRALDGKSVRFDELLTYPDGKERYVDATYLPRFGEDGEVRGYLSLIVDITERKQAEEALREREAQLRAITDNLPAYIAYADRDERFRFVNKTAEEWYARPASGIIGRSIVEIIGEKAYELVQPRIETALSGEVIRFEEKRHFPDGSTRDADLIYVPHFGENREVRGWFMLIQDITERKRFEAALREGEERFRTMMENSPSAIFLKDLDGRYQLANKRMSEWIGVDVEDMLGRSPRQFLKNQDFVDDYEGLDRTVIEQERAAQDVQKAVFSDGSVHYLDTIKFPVYDSNGRLMGIGGILTDVTEQRDAEEQLRQAQKMEAVGKLTGGVAHDFNNLLAVILGNTELLREKMGEDDSALEAVTKASRRGAELTQRLLSFSRQQPLRPSAIGLPKLISDMASMLRRTLGEKIEIETRIPESLWHAQADPGQLENAVLNLAINAQHAMQEGGRLVIEAGNVNIDATAAGRYADAAPGEYVLLSMTDTGQGMSTEVLARVFEPFFTTKEVGKGSGLGLSMVYGFARQSGGFVTIDSIEGRGSCVRLHLPRAVDCKPAELAIPVDAKLDGQGETILVVEDDPDVRKLTVTMLKRLGYAVLEAEDGETAVAIFEGNLGIDLLLSDVVLPGDLSGPDIADAARRRRPGLNILFMSGYAEDVVRRQSSGRTQDLDAEYDLLPKPFSRADLAGKVRAALERRKSQPA